MTSRSSTASAPIGPYVPGRGRADADIMLIGEAPGVQEEMMQKCWVGKAGKELARYLRQAGIDIRDCWLTNLAKHRPTTRAKSGNVKPTAADIKRDEGELVDEIERVRPTFIVGVGAVASRWLLGKRMFTGMEDCHAFPYKVDLCLKCGARYAYATIDDSISGEGGRGTERLLDLDRGTLRDEGLVLGDMVRGENGSCAPRSVDVVPGTRTTGKRSSPRSFVQQHAMCESVASGSDDNRSKRSTRKEPTSLERSKDSMQERPPIQQKEHVCVAGKARTQAKPPLPHLPIGESASALQTFTAVAVYHPAAGLHSPEQQPLVFFDFMTLGKYVRGTLPCVTPRDLHPDPDYYEPRSSVRLVKSLPIAVDTEGLSGRVWGLSFSQFPGSAGVVRATNRKAIASMKEQLLR